MIRNIDNTDTTCINEIPTNDQNNNPKDKLSEAISKMMDKKKETANNEPQNDEKSSVLIKMQPYFEKGAAIISAIDAIADPTNNYVDLHIVRPDVISVPTSVSTRAFKHSDQTVDELLFEKGYSIGKEKQGIIETIGEIISIAGSDDDAALEDLGKIKDKRDEFLETDTLMKNNKNQEVHDFETPNAITAFSASAMENYKYGSGGGNQLFIPYANEYKRNGFLEKIDDYYESEFGTALIADLFDMTESGNKTSDNNIDGEYIDEIDYLDKNTIDTEGLNRAVDNCGKKINQSEEDYVHPHSNQEDSEGLYYPDAWKKCKITDGTLVFQISKDGNTPSSYFTDSKTVNSCIHNGNLHFNELREKLQLANGTDKTCLSIYICKFNKLDNNLSRS